MKRITVPVGKLSNLMLSLSGVRPSSTISIEPGVGANDVVVVTDHAAMLAAAARAQYAAVDDA